MDVRTSVAVHCRNARQDTRALAIPWCYCFATITTDHSFLTALYTRADATF
jgi:hypothetical protein